jgi:hypothetical protein
MRNFAPADARLRHANCTLDGVFIDEFVFSFSLLAFSAWLLILGSLILLDAFRRFTVQWWSKFAGKKNGGVVLIVDIPGPIENRIRNRTHDLGERPVAVLEKKVG